MALLNFTSFDVFAPDMRTPTVPAYGSGLAGTELTDYFTLKTSSNENCVVGVSDNPEDFFVYGDQTARPLLVYKEAGYPRLASDIDIGQFGTILAVNPETQGKTYRRVVGFSFKDMSDPSIQPTTVVLRASAMRTKPGWSSMFSSNLLAIVGSTGLFTCANVKTDVVRELGREYYFEYVFEVTIPTSGTKYAYTCKVYIDGEQVVETTLGTVNTDEDFQLRKITLGIIGASNIDEPLRKYAFANFYEIVKELDEPDGELFTDRLGPQRVVLVRAHDVVGNAGWEVVGVDSPLEAITEPSAGDDQAFLVSPGDAGTLDLKFAFPEDSDHEVNALQLYSRGWNAAGNNRRLDFTLKTAEGEGIASGEITPTAAIATGRAFEVLGDDVEVREKLKLSSLAQAVLSVSAAND